MAYARPVRTGEEHPMKIHLTSVFVDDQAKAEHFYTEILGFVKKHDVPLGEEARWLTVVAPERDPVTLLSEAAGRRLPRAATRAENRDGLRHVR